MPDTDISSIINSLKTIFKPSASTGSTSKASKTSGATTSHLSSTNENELVSLNFDDSSSWTGNLSGDVDSQISQLMNTEIPKTRQDIETLVQQKATAIKEQEDAQEKAIQENEKLVEELKTAFSKAKKELTEAREQADLAAKNKAIQEKNLKTLNAEIGNVDDAIKANSDEESVVSVLQYKKDQLLSKQSSAESDLDSFSSSLTNAKSLLSDKQTNKLNILSQIIENTGEDSPLAKFLEQSEQKIENINSTFETNFNNLKSRLDSQENTLINLMQQKTIQLRERIQNSSNNLTTLSNTLSSTNSGTGSGSSGKLASVYQNGNFSRGVLKDKGGFIEQCCNKYGVDPYLVSAIMACETGWGTSNAVKSANNPGGYMDSATGYSTVKRFSSLEEGIEAVIKNLSKNYIKQGLVDIASIGAKYCPVGAANDPNGTNSSWVPTVLSIYNQLSGKNISANTKLV